jgi:hypothetical protein
MTMMLNIDDKYISKFKSFIASLPQGAVEMKGSLDDEILQRVSEYKKTTTSSIAFESGLDPLREKLLSKI